MASVDQIRAELNLTAPTQQTLRYLRATLGLGFHDKCEVKSRRGENEKPLQTKGSLRSRPPVRANTKQRQKQAAGGHVHEGIVPERAQLSSGDRQKIATEAFNLTLRHLGEAVKTLGRNDGSIFRPPQPTLALQERSPNRRSKSTTIPTKDFSQSTEPPDWGLVVECCHSALKCLRTCARKNTGSGDPKTTGSERGALILLDRTISMGFATQAISQLSEIQQQFQRCNASETPPLDLSLPELLLGRPDAVDHGSTFEFTASMQGQALRLALLVGHKCINPELVWSLRAETSGSPAWIILQGSSKGRTTSQQAALQLRTLALALHKLYVLGIKASADNLSQIDLFDLFCLSLQIKFESWAKAGAAPDSVKEVWQPYHRSFKKLSETISDLSPCSKRVTESLILVRKLLTEAKCKPDIPLELAETMLDTLHSSAGCAELLTIVEESLTTAASPTRVVQCQITVTRLKNFSANLTKTLSTVNGMEKTLLEEEPLSQAELSRFLSCLAQLRKEATTLLPDRATKQIPDEAAIPKELERSLISLIHGLFLFLKRHVAFALGPLTDPCQRSDQWAFFLTFAKTIDAVLNRDHCTVMHEPELARTAWEALKDCSEIVLGLQTKYRSVRGDSREEVLCNQVRIKISQRCWVRYLAAIKQHRPLLEQADILELSLKGLLQLPDSDQQTALAALKFEKLAYTYLEARNFETAVNAFRDAVAAGIRQGVLSNIAESLLSTSFRHAWSEDSSRKAFERVLTTYIKTRHAHLVSYIDEESFYDDQSLPIIHRAALVEKQMLAMFELQDEELQKRACTSMMQVLVRLLDRREYHVYMLRVVSHVLAIGLRRRTAASRSIVNSAHVQSLLDRDLAGKETVFLKKFELGLRSLVCMQHGFLSGWSHYQEFKHSFQRLCDHAKSLKTLEDSHVFCESVDTYVAPLLLSVDYASLNEDATSALEVLETLEHLAKLGVNDPALCLTDILVRKSNICLQQQQIESAGASLAMANKGFGGKPIETLVELELLLAYSEHHLQLLRLEDCLSWLLRAKSAWERQLTSIKSSSLKSTLKQQGILCRAAYVGSRLAYQQRQLLEAIVLARQATKIAASIWSSIDGLGLSAFPSVSTSLEGSETHNISVEFSRLDISCDSVSRLASTTISVAPYIALCFTVFSHMASLTSHCGIYQEATTFHEQALKIARKTSQSTHEAIALSELGVLHARAGQVNKAREVLSESSQIQVRSNSKCLHALIAVNQCEAYLVLGDRPAAENWLAEANRHALINVHNPGEASVSQIGAGKTTKSVAKSSARQHAAKPLRAKQPSNTNSSSLSVSALTLEWTTLGERISALEIKLQLLEGVPTTSCNRSNCSGTEDGPQWIPVAIGLVRSAIKLLSEDAVHSVLPETAVALPVRYRSASKSGRVSFVQPVASQTLVSVRGRSSKQISNSDLVRSGGALLLQAYSILQKLGESQGGRLSSDQLHTCHKILTKISLLSTALSQPLILSSLNLVLDITLPLEMVRVRHDYMTLGELTATRRINFKEWPTTDRIKQTGRFSNLEAVKEFDTGILPSSWSIVCVEVSEDKNELVVARLTREMSPFVVRIPLARPDPSAADIDALSLESARTDMRDIIAKANTTAHDGRGSSADKTTRAPWFAERQALDDQLSNLLDSIENTWFGGFRGLFSAPRRDQGKLAAFGQRLHSTLNGHLPSRQKTSRPGSSTVLLHDHVLELFVGLGHPQDMDLDDAVTDLLYFVIDILQFNGERNAYDEIDFDAMLIEVLDALYAYHDERPVPEKKNDHLILVLDKELQMFPWESLPCLRGQAVSRMPSLGSIGTRLNGMREQLHDLDAYLVPKTRGAYILNPSSDLKSTKQTFGELFADQLSDFLTIVNRHPTAQEFESVLKERELVLYFGHGGGGQYIRPRTIRKMDKCAVTLLMGCSSAKLTEYGVYEPSGMPLNYLSGGSPAIVGTLWDVTDRDIDRFALEMMEDWGLLDGTSSSGAQAAKKAGRAKNTSIRVGNRQRRAPVSLDQAVADARDACLLKYLNGAAPVMYGVPIILK